MRGRALLNCIGLLLVASLAGAPSALAQSGGAAVGPVAPPAPTPTPAPTTPPSTGGAGYNVTDPTLTATVAGAKAKLLPNGMAAAPLLAPDPVKQAIWAANQIIGKPYAYGGGHKVNFRSKGYDCSGTVSFALHGGDLLDSPLDSGKFMKWGEKGKGDWITVYTNPGHAYAVIAGLRLDTSSVNDKNGKKGPNWRAKSRPSRGFKVRHPLGF